MNAIAPPFGVAVVIATCNRFGMLSGRALPSVVAQIRRPDILVVVDDSALGARSTNAAFVRALELPGCKVAYLENARTAGASGSWNTALDFLTAETGDPSQTFVAVLDDDDSWCPEYLASSYAAAVEKGLDMIACTVRRIESAAPSVLTEAPSSLRASDFLTGNPGIQGSNLFVRLSVLLAAGGFDEDLRSSTDRDLCIRIVDLGSVGYGRLSATLVNHFADSDRTRLSTPGSEAKVEGLTAFWRKHAGRMGAQERHTFEDRASTLFGWRPPSETRFASPSDETPKKAIVLGLVADNERPRQVLEVVRELAMCRENTLATLDVVLLECGKRGAERAVVDEACELLRNSGFGCFKISQEPRDEAITRKQFRRVTPLSSRTEAEALRDVLLAYCARVAEARTGTEVWLVVEAERSGQPPGGTETTDILHRLGAARAETGEVVTRHADRTENTALDRLINFERVATAEHRVRRRFSLGQVRLLGCGSEAVVFTDERTVYKCIDYWKTRMPLSQLEFLKRLVGRWVDVPGL